MVNRDLTAQLIDKGRELLELMDRKGFRVAACFWLYDPESERWRFVVASPEVRVRGARAGYRKVGAYVRRIPNAADIFGPGTVTVLGDDDRLVVLLRKGIPTGFNIAGVRLPKGAVNGTLIDDTYIYRLRSTREKRSPRRSLPTAIAISTSSVANGRV